MAGWLLLWAGLALWGLAAETGTPAPAPAEEGGPRLVVLGTAQDGGVPHAGCRCRRCELARNNPAEHRAVASLGLVLPSKDELYLIDASPDLPEQLERLRSFRRAPAPERVDRGLLAGIFLTHAHMGHYLGLAHLGFEVMHTQGVPLWATPRMAAFLRANGPWGQLVRLGEIELREMAPESAVTLGEGVAVSSVLVPHRDEYSDTVAYRVKGPRATVLYVPDTEPWRTWPKSLQEHLEGVDVALLDGTFFSAGELPGREVSSIGHPLIVDSLELLGPLVRAGKLRVVFTHLNHSNPALERGSEARRTIEAAGFAVAEDGLVLPL